MTISPYQAQRLLRTLKDFGHITEDFFSLEDFMLCFNIDKLGEQFCLKL